MYSHEIFVNSKTIKYCFCFCLLSPAQSHEFSVGWESWYPYQFEEKGKLTGLDIEIFKADHTAYSKKLNKVVMLRDATGHTKEDFVMLSGTRVRDMLAAGEDLPPEFARPEVAEILMSYYQQEENL